MLYKQKEFKTKRLSLRPLKPTDFKAWQNAYTQSEPAQNRWDLAPLDPKKCTLANFKKVKAKLEDLAKKDDYYRYGVFDKSTGQMYGLIDFDIYVRGTHQFANFGYQIFNRHWGQGYGQEASAAGLIIGFKQLKLNRLEAVVNLDNIKSIRLCKAIGMKKEGIKKRYWYEYGKWTDHLIFVANPEDVGLKAKKPY